MKDRYGGYLNNLEGEKSVRSFLAEEVGWDGTRRRVVGEEGTGITCPVRI